MPRVCTVCRHAAREAIDAALVAGSALRPLGARFELSASAIRRHQRTHLPATLARAKDAADMANADDLLGQVKALWTRALAILDQAEHKGDLRTALAAIREARGVLELVARLVGEMRERGELAEPEVQAPRYVACWGGTAALLAEANAALDRAARAEAEVVALRRRLQLAGPVIDRMSVTVGTGSGT